MNNCDCKPILNIQPKCEPTLNIQPNCPVVLNVETTQRGAPGKDATINGVNTLFIETTDGISYAQSDETLTLSGQGLVAKTETASQVYGTDDEGNQTTYDVDSFGQVDDVQVDGISIVENKIADLGTMALESLNDYYTKNVADSTFAEKSYEGVIDNHIADKNNPHAVTKAQVGLGNCDNTSDLDKPISTATQEALDSKQATISDLSTIRENASHGESAYNTISGYGDIVTHDVDEFATAAQGALADTALQPNDNISEMTNNLNYQTATQVANSIAVETQNRENADIGLQNQIDAIVSSSDVFDIVGTYAELQAYDISTVPVNDIIKVLVDSTHSGAATYYRCVETGGVKSWSYIGSEGAYYTKAEADSNFVPQTRTVNNKALSSDITLTASDVGALPSSTVIPTVNNATLTIQKNGTTVNTFTANASSNVTANIIVPTATSDLTNDSGFLTNTASEDGSLTILGEPSTTTSSINIGYLSSVDDFGIALGIGNFAGGDAISIGNGTLAFGSDSIAIGYSSIAIGEGAIAIGDGASTHAGTSYAIQLGSGENEESNSFYVGTGTDNWKMLGGDGLIPDDRISSNIARSSAIPTVNDGTLTIQKNGTTVNTFTANASSNVTANITVPTDTADLTNGAGFITDVNWGEISGTLSNQTDLQNALDLKQDKLTSLNAGTDISIFSPVVPDEYTQLSSLGASGPISLGIKTTQDSKIECNFIRTKSGNKYVYQSDSGSALTTNTTAYSSGSGNGNWRFGNRATTVNTSELQEYTTVQDVTGITVNGTSAGTYTSVNNFTSTTNLKVLGSGDDDIIRIIYLKHWDGADLTRHIIPVKRNSDNAYGFYDLVSETFFGDDTLTYDVGTELTTTINFSNDTGYVTSTDLAAKVSKSGDSMTGNLEITTGLICLEGIGSTVGNSTSRLVLGSPNNQYSYLTGSTSGAFGIYSDIGGSRVGISCYPDQNLYPTAPTKTIDLGRSSNVWNTAYIDTLSDGSSSETVANIIAGAGKGATSVQTSGNQSIAGEMTFTDSVYINTGNLVGLYVKSTDIDKNVSPSSDKSQYLMQERDSNNAYCGGVRFRQLTSDHIEMSLLIQNKANTENNGIAVGFDENDNFYTFAPACQTNNSIVTTVAKNKAQNGYYKLGNGLIIQWGSITFSSYNATGTETLPTAFTSTNYSIGSVGRRSAGSGQGEISITGTKSTTQFSWRSTAGSNNYNNTQYWIAIGY